MKYKDTNLKITRRKGRRKASEAAVAKLEKQLGVTLPQDYREFLLTQNGGMPDPFYVEIPDHPYIENVGVGYICGLYAKSDPEGLLHAIEQTRTMLPEGQLPIAGDSDIFSISLTEKRGCIYFWDHEAPECEDEEAFNMTHATLMAGSFNEFLTLVSQFVDSD